MYTAFLALPPAESQTSPSTLDATTIPQVGLEATEGASRAVSNTENALDSQLLNNDTVKYVVVPAMFGGLGSVALRFIQEGGTFMASTSEENIQEIGELAEQPDNEMAEPELIEQSVQVGGEPTDQEPETRNSRQNQPQQTTQETTIAHDFVPSIQMSAGLEFLILVTSSILLGAVVGFIGAILSLDGPPEKANNKSKLAATALMFALFFPSVITVFQENAMSQARLIKADKDRNVLEEQVRKKSEQAENLQEVAHDQITNNIEILDSDSTDSDPSSTDGQSILPQGQLLPTNTLTENQTALIDSTKALVLNATSEEKAKEFITSIFRIGNSDNSDVREHGIRALREIEANPTLSEAIQQAAKEKAETLLASEELELPE